MAFTALALWFIARANLEWRLTSERTPELAKHLAVEVLPALLTANAHKLLKAIGWRSPTRQV